MEQPFRLFDLVPEIQIQILVHLPSGDLRSFISNSSQAFRLYNNFYRSFLKAVLNQHPHAVDNDEVQHLLYHIIRIKTTRTRPFDQGSACWLKWVNEFSNRHGEADLSMFPPSVRAFEIMDTTLNNIEFWVGKIQYYSTKFYPSDNKEGERRAVMVYHQAWENEHSFSEAESYRIRRALLLFELYCSIFHEPPPWPTNGRVSEQISFLRSLQPFLLAELDGIYGMIEWIFAYELGFVHYLTRVSVPLMPGFGVTPGGAKLEYFMSLGLNDMKGLLTKRSYGSLEPLPLVREYRHLLRNLPQPQNRFFVSAMSKCYEYSWDQRTSNFDVKYPPTTHHGMDKWPKAPEGTEHGSWVWQQWHGHTEYKEKMLDLLRMDKGNWRGLAFWDQERYERHARCVEEEDHRFRHQFSGLAQRARYSFAILRNFWGQWDTPNISYIPFAGSWFHVTAHRNSLSVVLPFRQVIFEECTIKDIERAEGFVRNRVEEADADEGDEGGPDIERSTDSDDWVTTDEDSDDEEMSMALRAMSLMI